MKDMEINEKIRYFRKQRGLSQELLAERTGINVNTSIILAMSYAQTKCDARDSGIKRFVRNVQQDL